MADAYAPGQRAGRGAVRAPGLRADQRDDRHHRGGEEPHAAGRAGRRDGGRRGAVQLPGRPAGPGRRGRRGAGAGVRTGLGGRRHAPRVPAGRGGAPDRAAQPAARRPGRRDGARSGAGGHRAGPAAPGARRRSPSWPTCSPAPAGRCSSPAAVPGTPGRQLAALAERVRRAAGHLGGGARALPRAPVVARRLRRVRLAAGRRADRRRRPDGRLGLRAEHVDDAARPAHRPGRRGGPGRPRPRRARRAPAGRGSGSSATPRRRPRDVAAELAARGHTATGYRTAPLRARLAAERPLAGRAVRRRLRRRPDRPADADDRAGRPAARRAGGRRRLRQLHGLPERVPVRAGRARLLLHPGVPVDRPRAGHRDRRRAGPAGPAAGRGARRRRRADGHRRAGHRGPARPADGGRGLRRRRVRRGGAPLRARRPPAGHRALPGHRHRRHRPRLRLRPA